MGTAAALTEPTTEMPTVAGTEPWDVPLDGMDFPAPEAGGPDPAVVTPEAPRGLKKDGTPRAKPGRKPTRAKPTTSRTTRTAPAPQPRASGKFASASAKPDYTDGVAKLLRTGVSALALIGMRRNDAALIADAAAVKTAVPLAAAAVNTAAQRVPILAGALEWLLNAAPHAGSAAAGVVALGQVLVNHGKLPPGLVPGTVPAEELTARFIAEEQADKESLLGSVLRAAHTMATQGQEA